MSHAKSRISAFITRMFTETADNNYILARFAFSERMYYDFYWLGSHAVEKYLKAALLYNGCSVRRAGHDLDHLRRMVRSSRPDIQFDLPEASGFDSVHWGSEPCDEFIKTLGELGHPENRYAIRGHDVMPQMLMKLDFLVAQIRSHCRSKWFAHTKGNLPSWWLSDHRPIEQLLVKENTDKLRVTFTSLNMAFAPAEARHYRGPAFAASNSELFLLLDQMRSADVELALRDAAAEALDWVLANVKLGSLEREVRETLSEYEAKGKPKT